LFENFSQLKARLILYAVSSLLTLTFLNLSKYFGFLIWTCCVLEMLIHFLTCKSVDMHWVKVKSKGSFTLANKSCSYPDSLNNATSNGIVPFFVVTQGAKASKVLAFLPRLSHKLGQCKCSHRQLSHQCLVHKSAGCWTHHKLRVSKNVVYFLDRQKQFKACMVGYLPSWRDCFVHVILCVQADLYIVLKQS